MSARSEVRLRHADWQNIASAACAAFIAVAQIALAPAAIAQDATKPDNGTDPTRLSRNFSVGYEFLDLPRGGDAATLTFRYGMPISKDSRTAVQFKLPITDSFVGQDPGLQVGDVSVKLTRVLSFTRSYGIVASAELSFDTASQPTGGSGTEVLKLTGVYARFLKGGAIFAPAIVHTERVGGRVDGRPDISNTAIDLYYVPKLANPRLYMTIDPTIKYDWISEEASGALAVTVGQIIQTGGAGTTSIYVKPSVGIGENRGLDAGIEIGVKVVGF
ncbi:MAG: hypothetical protein ACRC14_18070 [Paracoccaceae bacterium]